MPDYGAEYVPSLNSNSETNGSTVQPNKPWVLDSEVANLTQRPEESSASPVPFFHFLERLKTTKRAGWERMGIIKGESISDHMYRMSIMTMMAPTSITSTLDLPRCTKMALVHDMAEALVGDITPNDRVDKEEKSRREEETMDYICGKLLGGISGLKSVQEVRSAWQEYEDSKTAESIFVHDIDKMELLLQMVEYERKFECAVNLGEFAWVATKIHMPEIREWGKEVLLERVGLWKGAGKTPSWPNRPLERERFLEWAKEQGIPISA